MESTFAGELQGMLPKAISLLLILGVALVINIIDKNMIK